MPAERGCRESTFAVPALRCLAGAGAASAQHGALASALLLLLLGTVEPACFACWVGEVALPVQVLTCKLVSLAWGVSVGAVRGPWPTSVAWMFRISVTMVFVW